MAFKIKFNWKTIIIVILILLIISAGGYSYYSWVTRVIPEELLPEAISKTVSAQSYRYQVALKLDLNGEERVLSRVNGERNGEEFHLKGNIAAQDVDVYYVDETVYMKDSVSGRWMTNHGVGIFQQDLFMIEVNPIDSLNYEVLNNIVYHGIEKGKKPAYVMEYNPVITNKMLTTYWEDFQYKVWIDRKSKRIYKMEVFARHRDNHANGMHMQLLMYDFGKRIRIEAPEG